MVQTVEQFAAACREALAADPGPAGREKVCALVREVLQDKEFVAANIRPDGPERKVLYEDPDLGFTILAHAYQGAKDSSPHDHGPTWAIYGQATGETIMTDWECVARPTETEPGKARRLRDYSLTPGMAYLYEPGVLHSPRREKPTSLLRIEGMNLDRIRRLRYVAVDPPLTAL
jgi:predicted metal-dependent enzyme (double-stranded beta helix superfamily)